MGRKNCRSRNSGVARHCLILTPGMIVCFSGGKKPQVCSCGHLAGKLCDGIVPGKKGSKTCDKPLCQHCSTHVEPNLDFCFEHTPLVHQQSLPLLPAP